MHCPSSSAGGLVRPLPCFWVRPLSLETDRQITCVSPCEQAAVLHELLQGGLFPRSASLQEEAAPEWVPYGVTSSASRAASSWAPPFMGHRSCQEPAPAWASLGITASFRCFHLLWHWVDLCMLMVLHRLQGHTSLTTVCTRSCREISAPMPAPSSPFALALTSAELFLPHSHSSLGLHLRRSFPLLLK